VSSLHLITTILTAAALARYAALCWLQPFADCPLCHGLGHRAGVNRRTGKARRGRPCRWCRTTGKRLRVGRRVFNYLTAKATRVARAKPRRVKATPGPRPVPAALTAEPEQEPFTAQQLRDMGRAA
jgi:hypothetical protein